MFSSSTLKIIGAVTMVIDHIGIIFFPEQILFRVIGRISFPVFAFLIAEGYEKTSNLSKYFKRLLVFAFISEIPFLLVMNEVGITGTGGNIFVALSAGLLALATFDRLPAKYSVPILVVIVAIAQFINFDYGAYGILLILASWLFLKNQPTGAIALFLVHSAYSLLFMSLYLQVFALITIPILGLYNGKLGFRIPKWFYWFYPVHLILLWVISYFLF